MDPFIGGSALGGAAVAGNLLMEGSRRDFSRKEAAKQRKWASNEAQLARDFALEMSSTEVQRRRADLEAAGINPMLAMGALGGADVQSSMASGGAAAATPHGDIGLDFTSAAQLSLQAGLMQAQMRDVNSAADLKIIDAQTRAARNVADLDEVIARIDKTRSEVRLTDEQRKKVEEERKNLVEMRTQIIESVKNLRASRELTWKQAETETHRAELTKSQAYRSFLNEAKDENEAHSERDIVHSTIRQVMRTLGSLIPAMAK